MKEEVGKGYPWVLSFLNTMGRGQGSAGGQPRRGLGLGITGSPHTVHQQLLVQNLPLSAQPPLKVHPWL